MESATHGRLPQTAPGGQVQARAGRVRLDIQTLRSLSGSWALGPSGPIAGAQAGGGDSVAALRYHCRLAPAIRPGQRPVLGPDA